MTTRFAYIPDWLLYTDISDRAVHLYAALRLYANFETDVAWPTRRKLAEQLSCSLNSLDRAMNELVAVGAVVRSERRRQDGSRTSNEYLVVREEAARVQPPLPTGGAGPLPTDGAP